MEHPISGETVSLSKKFFGGWLYILPLYICRDVAKKSEENDNKEICQLIDLVNEAPQLSAVGLFDVKKKSLTSLFSFIVTYLIITIQFQMSSQ
jgi:hypothetical protein